MLFNSIAFLIFLPIVFILYHLVEKYNLNWQNILLLAASYLFYGWWDYRFLSLIIISSFADFFIGKYLLISDIVIQIKREGSEWSTAMRVHINSLITFYAFFLLN